MAVARIHAGRAIVFASLNDTRALLLGWIACVSARCNGGRAQEQRTRDSSAQEGIRYGHDFYSVWLRAPPLTARRIIQRLGATPMFKTVPVDLRSRAILF